MAIYKNSLGEERVVEEMDSNHLLNSFAKCTRLKATGTLELDESIAVLRAEIVRRIEK